MFTGIISHLGKLERINADTFTIAADPDFIHDLTLGASVAVNGVCLTVDQLSEAAFTVRLSPETLQRTSFGKKVAPTVNLERAATLGAHLDGHLVQGHVDGVGTLEAIEPDGASQLLTLTIPESLQRYTVEKGSLTVNGISLTIASLNQNRIQASIIPYTWEHTNLAQLSPGDPVNLEVDVIAKYVERLLTPYQS